MQDRWFGQQFGGEPGFGKLQHGEDRAANTAKFQGNRSMKIAVAGGGTAGHVNIGLEILRANRERGGRGIYLGGDSGYESRLVPRAGEQLEIIPAKPFALRSAGRKLAAVATIAASVRASRRVLLRERVHLVAGTRSYGVLKQFRDFG